MSRIRRPLFEKLSKGYHFNQGGESGGRVEIHNREGMVRFDVLLPIGNAGSQNKQ
jgi:hypothetical protein